VHYDSDKNTTNSSHDSRVNPSTFNTKSQSNNSTEIVKLFAYMAAARCAGFAFPGVAWRLGGDDKFRKSHSGVSVPTNRWRRRDDEFFLNLGLGIGGGCGCQAAAKDPGYKRSQSKKASSKKSGKPSSSVAEASDTSKQGKQQGAKYSEKEVSHGVNFDFYCLDQSISMIHFISIRFAFGAPNPGLASEFYIILRFKFCHRYHKFMNGKK